MKKQHVQLTQTDRDHFETLLSKGILKAKTYRRALGLLELDRGNTYTVVAETLGVALPTFSLWAGQYRGRGLKMLEDQPRPGRPIKISGEQRAKITCEKHGSCAWLAAIEPLTGHRLAQVHSQHTQKEYSLFCQALAAGYPDAIKIRLV